MSVLVGTSGWSYPRGRGTWNGVFYPARRPKGFDELAYYAERFSTVEVNSTFYRPADPALAQRWVDRTPASFQFAVKLYQKFTHPDMYLERHRAADWDVTRGDLDLVRAGLDPLATAGRLAALLLQFPPSFHAGADTRGYLDWLLSALAGYPLAVELRHRSWSDARADTDALLAQHRAVWVWIDEPKFADSVRQPDLLHASGDLVYARLHGRNAAQWWTHEHAEDRYNYGYSIDELAPIAEAVRTASAAGRKAVVYFNNHFSAKSAANAAALRQQLGDLMPGEFAEVRSSKYGGPNL